MKNKIYYLLLAFAVVTTGCDQCDDPENPKPTKTLKADFSVNQAVNCYPPCEVCFNNLSENADGYSWDFGNGQSSISDAPCITFTASGTYTVTLTAKAGTETKTLTKQVIIPQNNNITRFKEVLNMPNQFAKSVVVSRDGYVYVAMTNDPDYFRIKRYGPYSSAGGLYDISQKDFPKDGFGIADMVLDNNNNILLAGAKTSGNNYWGALRKYSGLNLAFEGVYPYQNVANSSFSSVIPDADGGYLLVGHKPLWNTGDKVGSLIVKTNGAGVKLNEDVIGITTYNQDNIKRVFKNPDNYDAYIGVGVWTDPAQDKTDVFISRINASGVGSTLSGSDFVGLNNNQNEIVNDAVQFTGNRYAMVGKYNGNVSLMAFTYQTSTIQQFDFVKNFPSLYSLSSICVLDGNQGFGVCGVTTDNKIYAAKLTISGDIVWEKTYGTCSVLTPNPDIAYTYWDGGFVIVGAEWCTDFTCSNPVIMKTDAQGNIN
jgi:PKD repeat protein